MMILGKSCIIIKSSYLAHLNDWQLANQMAFYMGWGPSQEDTVDQVVKFLQLLRNMMVDLVFTSAHWWPHPKPDEFSLLPPLPICLRYIRMSASHPYKKPCPPCPLSTPQPSNIL